MRIVLPYGETRLEAEWAGGVCLGTLDVAGVPALEDVPEAVLRVLRRPTGAVPPLREIVRPGERVAIVVSDSFRHTGIDECLPSLIEELLGAGVKDSGLRFVFATGTHRAPNEEERVRILGEEVYRRFHPQTFSHDPWDRENLVFAGATTRGTPVWVNKRVRECERIIATGAAVLHYFGGFGGGRKSILPGIAGVESIARNHSLNLHPTEDRLNPEVRIGVMDGNPVAEDMLEGARLCGVDFILNTVMNREGRVAGVFGGELEAAHQAAADFARSLFVAPFARPADLVIASAGTAKNFIQSHKALFNAFQCLSPRGRAVFLCCAPEGLGGNRFREWLKLGSREAIIAELRKNAEINGQTALSTLEKARRSIFVTGLSKKDTECMGARRADSLEAALDQAVSELAGEGIHGRDYYLMPSASYTVPVLEARP